MVVVGGARCGGFFSARGRGRRLVVLVCPLSLVLLQSAARAGGVISEVVFIY